MEDAFVGKEVIVQTLTIKKPDGFWSVKVTATHRRTENGVDWDERQATMEALDATLQHAFDSANSSLLQYLQSVNFDLFAESADGEDNSTKN